MDTGRRVAAVWVPKVLSPSLVQDIENAGWLTTTARDGWGEVTALVVANERVSSAEVGRFPDLRLVHKWGAGLDAIDQRTLHERGIQLSSSPGLNAASVAEHCFGMLLAVARQIPSSVHFQANREWAQATILDQGIRPLRGLLVGIIGMGAVGHAVARLAFCFGMKVAYTTRTRLPPASEEALGLSYTDLRSVLKNSQVLVLAASSQPAAAPLLTRDLLRLLRRDVIIVNIARASLIDEPALLEFLRLNPGARACLDVLTAEASRIMPVIEHSQVLITPHVAGRDSRAVADLNADVVRALLELDDR